MLKRRLILSLIHIFQQKLSDLGFQIEEASWLNPVPNVWSVHIRDKECALCFTNGKGATKKAALASALGEYFERLSTNYFFADFWLGETIANGPFVHYPNEKWFPLTENDDVPEGLLDDRLRAFYDPENELTGSMLIDLQSGNDDRGICGLSLIHISSSCLLTVAIASFSSASSFARTDRLIARFLRSTPVNLASTSSPTLRTRVASSTRSRDASEARR